MEIKALKGLLKETVLQLEKEVPYASAFAGSVTGRSIRVGTYEKSVQFQEPSKGVTLTAFTGSTFLEQSTNILTEESIRKSAAALLDACRKEGITFQSALTPDPGERIEEDFQGPMEIDPYSIPLEELVARAQEKSGSLKTKSDKIVNMMVVYSHEHLNELYVNRNKTLFQKLNRWMTINYAILQDAGKNMPVYSGDSKLGGYELAEPDPAEFERTLQDGLHLLHAGRITPGTYDCIFSPELSGMFAHEAFGHGTETDMYLKERAKGAHYLNKKVAAKAVQMFDNPAYEGIAGSFFFDHEGKLSESTQIIKDGILVSGLTDLNSAMRLKMKRTPNGRRESYSHKAYARMTNTYFQAGRDTLDAMIKDIKHGFLVDHATNGMEDPKGWGIQLEAMYAREIKDGKLTDNYFTPIIVTGYVPDLLNSITMIGNELKISGLGMCGKGWKEWVKVTDGGPYLRLKARLA